MFTRTCIKLKVSIGKGKFLSAGMMKNQLMPSLIEESANESEKLNLNPQTHKLSNTYI